MSRLTWLADVLRGVGLPVIETNGWRGRGYEMGAAVGVMGHHTASRAGSGDMSSLGILINGRSGLPGPLANLGLSRSGVYYIIADGRANHGGTGIWNGVSGNSRWIGIEAENSGVGDEPWPSPQYENYMLGTTALLKHLGRDASWFCKHAEYATPAGRKIDPWCCDHQGNFNGDTFRIGVSWLLGGAAPLPVPTPVPNPSPTPAPNLPVGKLIWPVLSTLVANRYPNHTSIVQQVTGAGVDGWYGTGTRATVINYQRANYRYLAITGTVDNRTGVLLIQNVLRDMGFYTGTLDGLYGAGTTNAVARFQQWGRDHGANVAVDGIFGSASTDLLWFVMPK